MSNTGIDKHGDAVSPTEAPKTIRALSRPTEPTTAPQSHLPPHAVHTCREEDPTRRCYACDVAKANAGNGFLRAAGSYIALNEARLDRALIEHDQAMEDAAIAREMEARGVEASPDNRTDIQRETPPQPGAAVAAIGGERGPGVDGGEHDERGEVEEEQHAETVSTERAVHFPCIVCMRDTGSADRSMCFEHAPSPYASRESAIRDAREAAQGHTLDTTVDHDDAVSPLMEERSGIGVPLPAFDASIERTGRCQCTAGVTDPCPIHDAPEDDGPGDEMTVGMW